VPLPETGTLDVKTASFAQVASFGPKTWKVIVPDGAFPPVIVAVSEIAPFGATGPETCVETAGPDLGVSVTVAFADAGGAWNPF